MTCFCDQTDFPAPLKIDAGLDDLPRALGIFPDWRLAILDAISRQPALYHWRARGETDFGVMLVEMGAYLFDVLSFYDSLISNDSYLKTSRLAGSTRKLTSLLGYLPRPAIASEAWLAAEAEGRRMVKLPAGTAFRSGEFDGNPPQVFELEQQRWLDPRANRHLISRTRDDDIPAGSLSSVLVVPNSLRIQKGSPVVLSFAGTFAATYVDDIQTVSLRSRRPASEISFKNSVSVPANSRYSELRIFTLGNSMPLWRASNPFNGSKVLLDSRAPVRTGEFVLFENQGSLSVRTVTSHDTSDQTVLAGVTTTVKNTDGDVTAELESPDVKTRVSELNLNTGLGWSSSDRNKINAYFGISDAARVLIPEKDQLEQNDPISIPSLRDQPRVPIEDLLLEDAHSEGVYATGSFDAASHSAQIDSDPQWNRTLMAPVNLFGNVIKVSRGETVSNELLGVGDATQQWQSFALKKGPLTYLPADNETGFKSTLVIRVGGIRWDEVASFFGVRDDASVYTVRQDESGTTMVEFGGGARLPGAAAVLADYRYGAGEPVPPADSIAQLARPVEGLRTIRNPLPAFGGGEAETADGLKFYAPNTGLLLGRTISLVDLEAAAHRVLGVEAVKAVFRWDRQSFEKRAVIYYIGDAQLKSGILASLQSMSEPDAAIVVKRAQPESASLHLELEIDSRFQDGDVIPLVQKVLYQASAPDRPGGLLHRTVLGPEGPVVHSLVMKTVLEIAGVNSIKGMTLNGSPIAGYGLAPGAEHYLDFGELGTVTSGIIINGVS